MGRLRGGYKQRQRQRQEQAQAAQQQGIPQSSGTSSSGGGRHSLVGSSYLADYLLEQWAVGAISPQQPPKDHGHGQEGFASSWKPSSW